MSSKNIEPSDSTANSNASYVESIKLEGFGESRAAPVILTPNNLSAHPAGTHVLISGRCEPYAKRVEVFDAGNSLGDAVVLGSRWFFYRVWGVPYRDNSNNGHWFGWIGHSAGAMLLFAQQTLDNGNSDNSAVRLLTVGTMKKSPPPVISAARVYRVEYLHDEVLFVLVKLAGTCEAGAKISIIGNGIRVHTRDAEHNGAWLAYCWLDKNGVVAFEADQTVDGFLHSDLSNAVSIDIPPPPFKYEAQANSSSEDSVIGVSASTRKPPTPTLYDPLGEGFAFPDKDILYSGTCEENAFVETYRRSPAAGWVGEPSVFGKKWYMQAMPFLNELGKKETLKVRQRVGGVYSEYSNSAIFRAELPAPLIAFPETMTSHSADDFYLSESATKMQPSMCRMR